jgi:presenilin-like A22 family membrane protease
MSSERSIKSGPMILLLVFVIAVQILSLALMPSLSSSEIRIFEDPESTTNPFSYMLLILAFTIFMLIAIKLKRNFIIGWIIVIAIAMSVYYVLSSLIPMIPAFVLSMLLVILLHIYPEWYIVDGVGLFVSAGVSTLFGISMTAVPALLLLIILALYDAISVYKTRHMVTLAEGVMEIKAPLLFVVPKRRDYSFRGDKVVTGKEKGAYFLGLGDAIIPTVLVISANWSLAAPSFELAGIGVNVIALGTMLGTYLGFIALMGTSRDKPQAGLPFLNGGAILGFFVGCFASGTLPF